MAEAEVGDDVYRRRSDRESSAGARRAKSSDARRRSSCPPARWATSLPFSVWTRHGNEVICEERGHIYQFEMAAMSAIAGCMPRTRASTTAF